MLKKKWLLIALVPLTLLAAIGGALFWIARAPNTKRYDGERSVFVPKGGTFQQLTDSLESAGILASRSTFEWFGKLTPWDDQVKAGHYAFESGASNWVMLDRIRKGLQSPVKLTIPPGTRPNVIAAVAGRYMAFEPAEFDSAMRDPKLAERLDVEPQHLFAYMMPETYSFYWLNDAPTVVRRIKEQFDGFYEREIAAKARQQNLSKSDVVTLASIVEWEAFVEAEKPRIAGVYLNRLRQNWPLQADPTVQFAVIEKEGRKRRLLFQDYRIQHPYNTYIVRGLPPGPVTNPSPSSLRAVVNAEQHDYMFFVARGDGSHTFSRTLAEHNRAANEYYQLMRQRRAQAPPPPGPQ